MNGWIPVQTAAAAICAFDPMFGRRGDLRYRKSSGEAGDVFLRVPARGSLMVAASPRACGGHYDIYREAGVGLTIEGPWTLRFDKGGPALPRARMLERLSSWTTADDEDSRRFSGTATYSTTFDRPHATAVAWQLDLGVVHDSARVRINSREIATLIADLDREGVVWKKFYNVNFPALLPENRDADGPFTAARWTPLDAGLIGPVTLRQLTIETEARARDLDARN